MEGRVVDEIDVDIRRLVIFTILASTVNQVGRDKELMMGRTSDLLVYSTKSCVGHDRREERV